MARCVGSPQCSDTSGAEVAADIVRASSICRDDPKLHLWCAARLTKIQNYEERPAMQKAATLCSNYPRPAGVIGRI
jgi:hypothetical protein